MLLTNSNNLSSLARAAVVLFVAGVLALCSTTTGHAQSNAFDMNGNLNQDIYPSYGGGGTDRGYYGGTAPGSPSERDYLNNRGIEESTRHLREWERQARESNERFRRQQEADNDARFGHTFYDRQGRATTCRQIGPNQSVCN